LSCLGKVTEGADEDISNETRRSISVLRNRSRASSFDQSTILTDDVGVLRLLPSWVDDYNHVRPNKGQNAFTR
jgi:hypothetical protein